MKKILNKSIGLMGLVLLAGCSSDFGNGDFWGGDGTGQGGSLARFATVQNNLYALNADNVLVYGISDPKNPQFITSAFGGPQLETIFPRDQNTLFLGAPNGMYIMDISNPRSIKRIGVYNHITSCDPVVADNNYAYVTLRSGDGRCRWANNRLEVIDITDLTNPQLISSQSMSNPRGLAISGNLLIVCDNGLKVYNRTSVNPQSGLSMIHHNPTIDAEDIIAGPKSLIVVGKSGVRQYQWTGGIFQELSRL
jgi:hypothetical protein